MLEEIKIFLLVLSSLFVVMHLFDIVMRVFVTEPKPIKFERDVKILLYLSISYIITFIII